MRVSGKVACLMALALPLIAAPAAGQNYRWDLGVNGGYSWYSSMLDDEATGLEDTSVKFKAGGLLGAQLGVWLRPNVGLRANATYADRPVSGNPSAVTDTWFEHVNLWSGSLDLLWRFRQPNLDWMGAEVLPYLALGLGAKFINPAGDDFNCVDAADGEIGSCQPFGVPDVNGTLYGLDEQRVLMGLVGLGTDIRLSPGFALRLEASDRIYKPRLYALTEEADGSLTYDDDESLSRTVHEVAGQIGLHLLLGLDRREVVSLAPAPAPPPLPEPAPPPAPVEEAVTVCVVDPTIASGLRMQSAYYRPATGDTVVIVNGERVALRNAVGTVMVARDAEWYVRGQPLTVRVGNENIEYLTYQGARHIEADQLAYLGTVNGYPVYADRDEVADVIDALNTARDADRSRDLGAILAERRDLRDELADVQFLYVPLDPSGCVFQTVQLMEPVTKGNK